MEYFIISRNRFFFSLPYTYFWKYRQVGRKHKNTLFDIPNAVVTHIEKETDYDLFMIKSVHKVNITEI